MRRAILSVADKTGIVEFGRGLSGLGWEIVSTGGTARALRQGGVPVKEVRDVTAFPEMLGGRVKTLHPAVHGGILARRDQPQDMNELAAEGIGLTDMVVCNLYPFAEKARETNLPPDEVIEEIDIGGNSLIRAAAKNWRWVIAVCSPLRYKEVLRQLKLTGDVDSVTRRKLAVEVFGHTAAYDSAIATYLGTLWDAWPFSFPPELSFGYRRALSLRYGENPHQKAAFYEPALGGDLPSLVNRQIQGKELSYNNLSDADCALFTVWDFPAPACAVVKHGSPCGVAVGSSAADAFRKAFDGDPVSAFGGVVAFNCPVDGAAVSAFKKVFLEVLLAPSFTKEATQALGTKKDLRVLSVAPKWAEVGDTRGASYTLRSAMGGLLVQERDSLLPADEDWKVVSKRGPTDKELRDLRFAMTVCKHVKSNAIVFARDNASVSIGGGQPNRVDCVRMAAQRAGDRARGAAMASDAFFPFPDSVTEAARAGISAVAHPGGSLRDEESIAVADASGMAMVLTGKRHFLH